MKTNIKYVQDIYDLAKGGVVEIAFRMGCHPITVERWREFGVPDKYWDPLEKWYGITPFEIFRLNAKIRGYSAKVLKD